MEVRVVKRWMTIFFCLFLLPLAPLAQTQPSSPIQIYLFYAEDCPNCQPILQSYVPTLKLMYPFLEIKTFDIGNPNYYEALAKLEKKFNRRGSELPVIFIGDQMLSGEREVMERLDPLILEYQMKGELAPPLSPVEIVSVAENSEKKFSVEIAYFYQKGCSYCDRANYLLKYFLKRYPHLTIKEIDLNPPDGKRLNETLSNRLNLPVKKRLLAPSIFIGNDYLSPEEVTESRVEALIQKYESTAPSPARRTSSPAGGLSLSPDEIKKADASIIKRFESLGIPTILVAGLFEGVDPLGLGSALFF